MRRSSSRFFCASAAAIAAGEFLEVRPLVIIIKSSTTKNIINELFEKMLGLNKVCNKNSKIFTLYLHYSPVPSYRHGINDSYLRDKTVLKMSSAPLSDDIKCLSQLLKNNYNLRRSRDNKKLTDLYKSSTQ